MRNLTRPVIKSNTAHTPADSTGESINRRWYYLGIVLVLASILFRQPLLLVAGLLLLLVLGLTDIWAHYCLHELYYKRELSEKRVFFGEEITLSVLVENAKLLPLPWLETQDTIPRALPIKGHQLRNSLSSNTLTLESLFSPSWYERITRRYTLQCTARGVHTFGPTTLRSGDIFGFISRELRIPNRQYLLVYPLVVPLSSFRLPARHPFGDMRAPLRLLEDPSRVIGIRDYAYGDSLRRVDWKATARAMKLQSRIYEETTTHTLILFLNAASRMDMHYSVHPELQELAICGAASVANWGLDQGYAVGLYANTIMFIPDDEPAIRTDDENEHTIEAAISDQLRKRRIHVPAASNEQQRTRLMEVLARIQNYFGTSIEELIQHERTRLPAGSTVVVLTSYISDVLIDTLTQVRNNGHAVSILFVGEVPPPVKLAKLNVYHLGGEETWQQLLATHIVQSNDTGIVPTPTFRL